MIQHLSSHEDKTQFKESILNLLNVYYENPMEVFESIENREFILYSKSEDIQGFLTFKRHMNGQECYAYLGVICISTSKFNILKILMDQFVLHMKSMYSGKVYTWAITQFYRTQKIFDAWFESLKEVELKTIHPVINSLGEYGLQDLNMNIENTQFIGKYKAEYIKINKKQNQKSERYAPIVAENERILLIGKLK